MDITLFVTPAAGALIGYFTNYLAIKMLFRPYTEKYFMGIKLPFTPGLIPKEKDRIAHALGETIGTHLLNEEVVMNALTKDDVLKSIGSITDGALSKIEENKISIHSFLQNSMGADADSLEENASAFISEKISEYMSTDDFKAAFSEILYTKLKAFLQKPICELPYESLVKYISDTIALTLKDASENQKIKTKAAECIWEFLCGKRDDERKLSEIISPSTQRELKDYISLKTPAAVNMIISATEDPEVEGFLKSKLSSTIMSIAGPFMGMFINSDDIYVKIIEQLTEYINNPENMPEIEKAVDKITDRFLDCTLGSVLFSLTGELRENMVSKAVSFIMDDIFSDEGIDKISEKISGFFENNKNSSVFDLINKNLDFSESRLLEFLYNLTDIFLTETGADEINKIVLSFIKAASNSDISCYVSKLDSGKRQKIKDICISLYKKCVSAAAPMLLGAFDIATVARKRIESFSMEEIEKIIIEIADRELKSITMVGGVLGLIIGFVPVVLNFI